MLDRGGTRAPLIFACKVDPKEPSYGIMQLALIGAHETYGKQVFGFCVHRTTNTKASNTSLISSWSECKNPNPKLSFLFLIDHRSTSRRRRDNVRWSEETEIFNLMMMNYSYYLTVPKIAWEMNTKDIWKHEELKSDCCSHESGVRFGCGWGRCFRTHLSFLHSIP